MSTASTPRAHLVPLLDVNWVNFAPMDPKRGYLAEPPPIEQCATEVERCVDAMRNLTDGRVVYTVHSGTYCRKAFYEEPFLCFYRRAVEAGGEICVHTHEEIAGKGTRNHDREHVTAVIRDRINDLKAGGITPTSYRGGHFAYMDYLTPLLEEEGLLIDFSCAPGFNEPAWDACWPGAPFSAYYLCHDDHTLTDCPSGRSNVLEIPLGADGLGNAATNYLYTEECSDEDLRRVWGKVIERAEAEDRPQFVHILFHTSSIAIPRFYDRFRRFLDHVSGNGGAFVSPTEARRAFEAIEAGRRGGSN